MSVAVGEEARKGRPRIASRPKPAWVPKKEVNPSSWVLVGRYLGGLDRVSQWWIGDWLVYGRTRWGKTYGDAAKITGYDYGSLRNMAYLASEFDVSRRRDNLTWSHHSAVAGLDHAEQDRWLDRAEKLGLSVADLRIELRAARRSRAHEAEEKGSTPPAPDAQHELICPNCGQAVPLVSDAREMAPA